MSKKFEPKGTAPPSNHISEIMVVSPQILRYKLLSFRREKTPLLIYDGPAAFIMTMTMIWMGQELISTILLVCAAIERRLQESKWQAWKTNS